MYPPTSAAALFILTTSLHAATPSTASILADFDFMTAHIEKNYAGYSAKINNLSRPALQQHTVAMRAKLESADQANPMLLGGILHEWLLFFHDHHLGIRYNQDADTTTAATPTAAPASDTPTTTHPVERIEPPFTADTFGSAYAKRTAPHPLEGLWQIDDSRYLIAVTPSSSKPGSLDGTIVSSTLPQWKPGDVKLRFHLPAEGSSVTLTDLWVADRSYRESAVTLLPTGTIFQLAGVGGTWTRLHPVPQAPNEPERLVPSREFFLSRISPSTLWLRVPNFQNESKPALDALLEANKDDLATTPNLIIDARNNSGGQDFVYEPLLRLAYTRPIYSVGIEILSTAANIAAIQKNADDPSRPQENRDAINAIIARMKSVPEGTFVAPDGRPVSITTFPEVLENPKRIAILIDSAGSSGEQFILEARQSRKVTLFGTSNTLGVLDYSNQIEIDFPSKRFTLLYPISRSLRLPEEPIDNTGIDPDIRIPKDTPDPIAFAQRWLERQVD